MKKILVASCLFLLIGVNQIRAGQTDLFSYNTAKLEKEMAQLDQLEKFILATPGITRQELAASHAQPIFLNGESSDITGFNRANEKAFGIPGFCWGCIFWVPGVIIVHLVAEDPHETKMAAVGCIVSTLLSGGGWWYYR